MEKELIELQNELLAANARVPWFGRTRPNHAAVVIKVLRSMVSVTTRKPWHPCIQWKQTHNAPHTTTFRT